MDGRIGHFSYLIEEVESDFFQKTAEEIAQENHIPEPEVIFDDLPVKMAHICIQSSQSGLSKEASAALSMDDGQSYEAFMGKLAAASSVESLGISKTAVFYLSVLEKMGCDVDELAGHVLDDTLAADECLEKCGFGLASLAIPTSKAVGLGSKVWSAIRGAGKATGRGIARAGKATGRGIATAGKATGRGIAGAGKATGRGIAGAGKATGRGIADAAGAVRGAGSRALKSLRDPTRSGTTSLRGRFRERQMKKRIKKHQKLTAPIEKLKAARKKAQEAYSGAGSAAERARHTAQIESLTNKIRSRVPAQREAGRRMTSYERNLADRAGMQVPRTEGGGPKYRKSVEKAQRDADKSTSQAKKDTSKAVEDAEDAVNKSWKSEVDDLVSRGSNRKFPARSKGESPKGDGKGGGGQRPPKKDVEGKGMGVMDAWEKWGKSGWDSLTSTERSRLVRAGVVAGGGMLTYKTMFDN